METSSSWDAPKYVKRSYDGTVLTENEEKNNTRLRRQKLYHVSTLCRSVAGAPSGGNLGYDMSSLDGDSSPSPSLLTAVPEM